MNTLRERLAYEIGMALRDEDAIPNVPCAILSAIRETAVYDKLGELEARVQELVNQAADELIAEEKLTHESVDRVLAADGDKLENYFSPGGHQVGFFKECT